MAHYFENMCCTFGRFCQTNFLAEKRPLKDTLIRVKDPILHVQVFILVIFK